MAYKYTERDAAKETNSGGKETARAWHQAREDARDSGEISRSSDSGSKSEGSSGDSGRGK